MVLSFHPETARRVQSTAFSNQRMESAASIVREDENFANTAAEALRFGHNAHIQDFLGCARLLLRRAGHLRHAVHIENPSQNRLIFTYNLRIIGAARRCSHDH